MIETIEKCDRCGEEVSHKSKGSLEFRRTSTRLRITKKIGLSAYDYTSYNYDLCGSCLMELIKFIENGEM